MLECWHDVKYWMRLFRTSPGPFTAIVATLAVAIGGNATVFSWMGGIVLHPMAGVPAQDRIVAIAGSRLTVVVCFRIPSTIEITIPCWTGSSRAS